MIIAIEGVDGAGKATQAKMLLNNLLEKGVNARMVSFPRYETAATFFTKKYLNGDYGDCSGKTASVLFAVDRFDYFANKEIDAFLKNGGVLITDRYTTSNFEHQAAFVPDEKKQEVISWIKDLEYGTLRIPAPDIVVFLDVEPSITKANRVARNTQNDGLKNGMKNDILEKDDAAQRAYDNAQFVAESEGWIKINCTRDGRMMRPEDINQQITEVVFNEINKKYEGE